MHKQEHRASGLGGVARLEEKILLRAEAERRFATQSNEYHRIDVAQVSPML